MPINDRREQGGTRGDISPHRNLARYLRLLDFSSRLLPAGKVCIPHDVAEIQARLGSSLDIWQYRMERLGGRTRIFGICSRPNAPKSTAGQNLAA